MNHGFTEILTLNIYFKSLLTLFISQSIHAKASHFLECTFQDNQSTSSISVTQQEYELNFNYEGVIQPYLPWFKSNNQPKYTVVSATETLAENESSQTQHNLFVSEWLNTKDLTQKGIQTLATLRINQDEIKQFRLAFPTDLFKTFLYFEAENKDGTKSKLALAGLSFGSCK